MNLETSKPPKLHDDTITEDSLIQTFECRFFRKSTRILTAKSI
jgi:hypothetical protein